MAKPKMQHNTIVHFAQNDFLFIVILFKNSGAKFTKKTKRGKDKNHYFGVIEITNLFFTD